MALITLLAVTSINLRKVVDMFFTKASHSFYSFFPNTTTRDSEHTHKKKKKKRANFKHFFSSLGLFFYTKPHIQTIKNGWFRLKRQSLTSEHNICLFLFFFGLGKVMNVRSRHLVLSHV